MSEYIEREALIDNLQKFASDEYSSSVNNIIMGMPKADVAPVVHSYWEHKITSDEENIGICHNCKYPVSWFYGITKYCPNCGAKMNKPNESEN